MVLAAATPRAMDGLAARLLPRPATRQEALYRDGVLNAAMPRLRPSDDRLQVEG